MVLNFIKETMGIGGESGPKSTNARVIEGNFKSTPYSNPETISRNSDLSEITGANDNRLLRRAHKLVYLGFDENKAKRSKDGRAIVGKEVVMKYTLHYNSLDSTASVNNQTQEFDNSMEVRIIVHNATEVENKKQKADVTLEVNGHAYKVISQMEGINQNAKKFAQDIMFRAYNEITGDYLADVNEDGIQNGHIVALGTLEKIIEKSKAYKDLNQTLDKHSIETRVSVQKPSYNAGNDNNIQVGGVDEVDLPKVTGTTTFTEKNLNIDVSTTATVFSGRQNGTGTFFGVITKEEGRDRKPIIVRSNGATIDTNDSGIRGDTELSDGYVIFKTKGAKKKVDAINTVRNFDTGQYSYVDLLNRKGGLQVKVMAKDDNTIIVQTPMADTKIDSISTARRAAKLFNFREYEYITDENGQEITRKRDRKIIAKFAIAKGSKDPEKQRNKMMGRAVALEEKLGVRVDVEVPDSEADKDSKTIASIQYVIDERNRGRVEVDRIKEELEKIGDGLMKVA